MERPERVAFLGLGIMGWPMAANLAGAGFELSVWTRSGEKAERFAAEHGARAAATPAEAAEGAEAAITMVVDAREVKQVLLGRDGATRALGQGALVADMTTIAPSASRELAQRLREHGIAFLDAPVSGSRPKAEDGTLTIMVGGGPADFERVKPLLDAMGELVAHVGPQGHGSMLKLLTNTMGAINAAALAQGLTVARAAGLDLKRFLEVAPATAGGSTMLSLKARPMVEHDFEPLFKLGHMLKDVRHCLAEARALGAGFPLAEQAAGLYEQAAAAGHRDEDFAAVITSVEPTPSA